MTDNDKPKGNKRHSNCRNCGAPLEYNGDCSYCGTKRQYDLNMQVTESFIEITAGGIRLGVVEG